MRMIPFIKSLNSISLQDLKIKEMAFRVIMFLDTQVGSRLDLLQAFVCVQCVPAYTFMISFQWGMTQCRHQ